jgi:hypothetical protein
MGDFRAGWKIELTLYGKVYKQKVDWVNYTPNVEGVDERIISFFSEAWDDAKCRFDDQLENGRNQQREVEERQEYERLKTKFEKPVQG